MSGADAYQYWQSQINQSLESVIAGTFDFTGIPTAFNKVIDVDIAMNMGNHSAIGQIVLAGAVELGTKKVEKVTDLVKGAKEVAKKVEKALNVKTDTQQVKQLFKSVKDHPAYPQGFRSAQDGTTKNTVKDKDILDMLSSLLK